MRPAHVRVRPVTAGDTSAMLVITRNVWGGTDYLPYTWHTWLNDSDGTLMVAEADGQVIGLQHVSRQDERTAWVEGIRVAEVAQGLGVGKTLLSHGLEWAHARGCTVARLSTASSNEASNRLAEGGGLHLISTFHALTATRTTVNDAVPSIGLAHPADVDRVFRHLSDHRVGLSCGMYTEGWTAYALTRERVRLLVANKSVAITPITQTGHILEGVVIATCGCTKHRFDHVFPASQSRKALWVLQKARVFQGMVSG